MEQCPRCKSPHDNLNGVVQHLVKSLDEAHEDVSTVSEGIREVAHYCKSTVGDGDKGAADHSDSTVESTVDGTVNETVADGSGFMPDGGDLDAGDDGDDDSCPDCGHEDYYGATELLRSHNWAADTTQDLAAHERVCADCGEIYG